MESGCVIDEGRHRNAGSFRLHDILLEFLFNGESYADFDSFYSKFLDFFKNKYDTDILEEFRARWEWIKND